MDFVTSIGAIAGILIPVSFIPQLIRVFRLKSAREISVLFTIIQLLGLALWLTYGVMLGLVPVVVCNTILAAFVIMLLVAKMKYGRGA